MREATCATCGRLVEIDRGGWSEDPATGCRRFICDLCQDEADRAAGLILEDSPSDGG